MAYHIQKGRKVARAIPWRYGVILCAVVSLLLFHLWEQSQVARLDARIRKLRSDMMRVEVENSRLTAEVILLSGWSIIVKRAEGELEMTYPPIDCLILIQESDPGRGFSAGEGKTCSLQ